MLLLGCNINMLTRAMVLAIGIVVDGTAIIVAENIHRHTRKRMTPFDIDPRLRANCWPVVAMTTTLSGVTRSASRAG